MKKVINGAMYNTETAKELAYHDNGYSCNDFGYFNETLYVTKSGKYFLHGEGGGNSRYGEWHGNTGGWGEKIMPLSVEDAQKWAEENLDGDQYEYIFGVLTEDSATIGARIPMSLRDALETYAAQNNLTMTQTITQALEKFVK